MSRESKKAFTLVELLVVISIVALLLGILTPALVLARQHAQKVVCRSNISQLVLANTGYALDSDNYYVRAASDMYLGGENLHRWHGVRWPTINDPFDPLKGPLVSYLADGKVKECPGKPKLKKGSTWNESFEKGAGGYGYNMAYIGGRMWQGGLSSIEEFNRTANIAEVKSPAGTLMFSDTAFLQNGILIEYSFAEPYYRSSEGKASTEPPVIPSIHFRHRNQTNIGWCDGHISARTMAELDSEDIWQKNSFNMNLGWFEPIDNTFFDLE